MHINTKIISTIGFLFILPIASAVREPTLQDLAEENNDTSKISTSLVLDVAEFDKELSKELEQNYYVDLHRSALRKCGLYQHAIKPYRFRRINNKFLRKKFHSKKERNNYKIAHYKMQQYYANISCSLPHNTVSNLVDNANDRISFLQSQKILLQDAHEEITNLRSILPNPNSLIRDKLLDCGVRSEEQLRYILFISIPRQIKAQYKLLNYLRSKQGRVSRYISKKFKYIFISKFTQNVPNQYDISAIQKALDEVFP